MNTVSGAQPRSADLIHIYACIPFTDARDHSNYAVVIIFIAGRAAVFSRAAGRPSQIPGFPTITAASPYLFRTPAAHRGVDLGQSESEREERTRERDGKNRTIKRTAPHKRPRVICPCAHKNASAGSRPPRLGFCFAACFFPPFSARALSNARNPLGRNPRRRPGSPPRGARRSSMATAGCGLTDSRRLRNS